MQPALRLALRFARNLRFLPCFPQVDGGSIPPASNPLKLLRGSAAGSFFCSRTHLPRS